MEEHLLTKYIRTKTVFKHRLKDLKDYGTVKIYVYELEKLNCNYGPLLWSLRNQGQIWYDKQGNFKALRKGPIDPSLLERTKKKDKPVVKLTDLHLWMREQLHLVEIPGVPLDDLPVYFRAFIEHRDKHLGPFFSVDAFSGRVHTPVVNLKGDLRFKITLDGQSVVSLDVKQMQPTILAKVLLDAIGDNVFSDAIFKGEDVYILLQKQAGLPTRDDAKKYLFQLIFGKPMDDIGSMFKGDTAWVDWINAYKSRTEPRNPHKEDTHTNLAWLLQFSEVQVMGDIWKELRKRDIPFLTIHDDVLCRESDKDVVSTIMNRELSKHFKRFELTETSA